MAPQRKAIGRASIALGVVAIIVAAAVGIIVVTNRANQIGPSKTPSQSTASGITSTGVTTQLSSATEGLPNNFSVSGKIPYLVITPQNNTVLLAYDVTAYNYTLNLSYEQENSYAVTYSNGTQWLSTSRACQTTVNNSTTTIRAIIPSNATVVTRTGIPCGSPNGEWYPVNGEPVVNVQNINASEVQVSIQPTSVRADTAQAVQVRVRIEMHPGVYAINLGMGIQAQGSSRPVLYLLGYTPVIVQG